MQARMQESFVHRGQPLVADYQPPEVSHPGKRPLHMPSLFASFLPPLTPTLAVLSWWDTKDHPLAARPIPEAWGSGLYF